MEEKKPKLIEYLSIIVKWRRFLAKVFFTVCFIAAAFSLMMSKTFNASATILPPTQDDGFGLTSLLSNFDLPFANFLGGAFSAETQTFLAIINSRTMMETVVEKYNLQERYQAKDIEKTIKQLREKIAVNINEEGTITITCEADTKFLPSEEDENEARKLAMDMANFIVSELDKTNIKFKTEKASNNRIFIENRYNQNMADLTKAELALNDFQKKNGAIDLPTQAKEGIAAAANLKAEIIAKEIEVNSLEQFFSRNHSSYKQALTQLTELKRKYEEFKYGASNGNGTAENDTDIFIPFEDMPDLGLQYARLYRELLLQEKLLEFILPLYEQAKIQEAKDTPTLQVLDEAVIPIKRSRPKRTLFVLFWGMVSILISLAYIFFVENLDRLKNTSPKEYDRIAQMYQTVRNDITIFKKKKHDQ